MIPNRLPFKILHVEDTPADAILTADALSVLAVPVEIHLVTDGAQAVEFLNRSGKFRDAPRPDLILLDLELPRVNGSEVLDFIKNHERLKSIPVIVFSTVDTLKEKRHAYDLHANSYVVKPMDLDVFTAKVRSIAEYWCCTSANGG